MNNEQIDNTDYYRLPCGKYLEDFICIRSLNFVWGSALKYLWRAGKKDGESHDKDTAKADHYVKYIACHTVYTYNDVQKMMDDLMSDAFNWDGKQ